MIEPLILAWNRDDVDRWFDDHGAAVITTIILLFVATALVRWIVPRAMRPAVARQMDNRPEQEVKRRAETLSNVIVRTAQVIFVVLALFTILPELGIDIRAVLAGVSITSIAIGLGAQSLVRDALNGLFILTENQYAVGDTVTIAGVTGTVQDISLRRTVIRDIDGTVHTVPNGTITTTANYTRDSARVRVMIPIAPTSDFERVREIADAVGLELARDSEIGPLIREAPRYLRVDAIDMMGGAAVNVNGLVVPGKQWEVAGALRARLIAAFQREGIAVKG
jgi:small conductance mechanosensitive channel